MPSKSNKQKNLKVKAEKSRIRIRNRSKCARHCEIVSYFYNFRDNKESVDFRENVKVGQYTHFAKIKKGIFILTLAGV